MPKSQKLLETCTTLETFDSHWIVIVHTIFAQVWRNLNHKLCQQQEAKRLHCCNVSIICSVSTQTPKFIHTHMHSLMKDYLMNSLNRIITFCTHTCLHTDFIPQWLKKWASAFKEMNFLNLSLNWNPQTQTSSEQSGVWFEEKEIKMDLQDRHLKQFFNEKINENSLWFGAILHQ